MKIKCIGAGPAGLTFAISMKLRDPAHEVHLFERNAEGVTFGWGVVFSDQTVDNLARQRPGVGRSRSPANSRIGTISTSMSTASRCVSSGHGFIGIGRKRLLEILTERARELGVDDRLRARGDADLADWADWDLVIAADGTNSRIREAHADALRGRRRASAPTASSGSARARLFDAFTFAFEQTEAGWIWAHAYRFADDCSTFIVECAPATWAALGFDTMSQAETIAACERIFADYLDGAATDQQRRPSARVGGVAAVSPDHLRALARRQGHPARRRRAHRAFLDRVGDQAGARGCDQAGRGAQPARARSLTEALAEYQAERSLEVLKLQNSARNSTEWFETVERYLGFEPWQFAYSLLTRSQRISHENLRLRDGDWLGRDRAPLSGSGRPATAPRRAPPMFAPFRLREHDARQSHRRLADGDLFGDRRHAGRLPPRPLWRARRGRRGPGVHRDDLRFADRADHAGLHRHVCARACRGVAADHRFRPCPFGGEASASSLAIRAARDRPSSAGRRWTRRSTRATGR